MSNQLSSLKYLPAEYLTPEVEEQDETLEPQSPYTPPISSGEQDDQLEAGRWTGTMSFVAGFMSIAGGIGIVQGLWGIWGLVKLESQIASITEMSHRMPQLKDTVAVLEAQLDNWNLLIINVVIGLIVSIGFVFSSYMFKNRKENGHMLIAAFCGLAILFHLTTAYVSYLSLKAIPTLSGSSEGAAALGIAMGAIGIVIFIKTAIYLAIAAYVFNRNSKAIFAPKVSV